MKIIIALLFFVMNVSGAFAASTGGVYTACYVCDANRKIPDKIGLNGVFKAYANDIKSTESLYSYGSRKKYGYLGAYQMNKAALIEAGFVQDSGNLYGGTKFNWTALAKKHGVTSKETFLKNRKAQDMAFLLYTEKQLSYIKKAKGTDLLCKDIKSYDRTGAIDIWGMLEGAYYFGVVDVIKSLKTPGYNKQDAMGISLYDYFLDGAAIKNKCIVRKNIVNYLGRSDIY